MFQLCYHKLMTIKEIDQLIEEGNSLKQIAQSYCEIANQKIKRIRANLDRNRQFFNEISEVCGMVKTLSLKNKVTLPKTKIRLSIILTSNYRFYGNINSDLIDFYIALTKDVQTDRIFLGKAAIDYFKANNVFKEGQEIILKSDQPTGEELTSLVNIIKDYNQVLVFYPRFKSLLVQEPVFSDITTLAKISQKSDSDFKFIFEPDLPKLLSFFDSQILTLVLEETFLEAEVARTASRFISMDQAETEANKYIKEYIKVKAYAKRTVVNNQTLENFASMAAVRRNQ